MYSKHLTKRLSTIMTSLTAYLKIRKVTLGNLQAEFFFSRAPKQSQIFSKILMSYAEPFFGDRVSLKTLDWFVTLCSEAGCEL